MRLILAVAAMLAGCGNDRDSDHSRALPAAAAAQLLENRNWIDRWPQSDTEELHVYRFTPSMGGGVFQDRTLFAGRFELFTYEIEGDTLTINWPHTAEKDRIELRIAEVDGPEPFDLRLDLPGTSRGPRTYFGRSNETAADELALRPPGAAAAATRPRPAAAP